MTTASSIYIFYLLVLMLRCCRGLIANYTCTSTANTPTSSSSCEIICNSGEGNDRDYSIVDCGSSTQCTITCASKACLKFAHIYAQNASSLIAHSTAHDCFESAQFHLPEHGNASFSMSADIAQKSFKNSHLIAGRHTQFISMDCTDSTKGSADNDECRSIHIEAQTAHYLEVIIGVESKLNGDAIIDCPRGSTYRGSYRGAAYDAPCVFIVNGNGDTADHVTVNTAYGHPRDVQFIDLSGVADYNPWRGIELYCPEVYAQMSSHPFTECLNTWAPTVSPTTSPTVAPTVAPTFLPTFSPTMLPTRFPTRVPTRLPSLLPTGLPSASPTALPTSDPTFQPTNVPTFVPTNIPTNSPVVASTLDEEGEGEDEDDEDDGDGDSDGLEDTGDQESVFGLKLCTNCAAAVYVTLGFAAVFCCACGCLLWFCHRKHNEDKPEAEAKVSPQKQMVKKKKSCSPSASGRSPTSLMHMSVPFSSHLNADDHDKTSQVSTKSTIFLTSAHKQVPSVSQADDDRFSDSSDEEQVTIKVKKAKSKITVTVTCTDDEEDESGSEPGNGGGDEPGARKCYQECASVVELLKVTSRGPAEKPKQRKNKAAKAVPQRVGVGGGNGAAVARKEVVTNDIALERDRPHVHAQQYMNDDEEDDDTEGDDDDTEGDDDVEELFDKAPETDDGETILL